MLGEVAAAVRHHHQTLRHAEAVGDSFHAGVTRLRVALALHDDGRYGDGLHYARAALANFQQVGPGAAATVTCAEQAIEDLERKASS